MMSEALAEKVKNAVAERSVKQVKIFDGSLDVLCRRHSIKGIEAVQDTTDNESIIGFLADQFLDPDDRQPVFTKEMLLNEVPNEDTQEMLKIFFSANGADLESMEQVEKNLKNPADSTGTS